MLEHESIKRAMLEGALRKANDAVHADQIRDFDYAVQAYGDSCALLGQVMARTMQGCEDWKRLEEIRTRYIKRIDELREGHQREVKS